MGKIFFVLLLLPSILLAEDSLLDIAGCKGGKLKSSDAFNFVVISDRTGGHIPGKLSQAVDEINLMQPDFVISVGDLIEGGTNDVNQITAEWKEFDEIVKKIGSPFFYCPGNHDVTSDIMLKYYQDKYGVNGKSYYSFNYKRCHFIILDSFTAIRNADFAKEQVNWLKEDIEKAKGSERFFVFYHNPRFEEKPCWNDILNVLVPRKTTVFNGHWHSLESFVENEIEFHALSVTGGGISENDPATGKFYMFAYVSFDKDKEKIAFIPMGQIQNTKDSYYYNKMYPLTKKIIASRKDKSDKFAFDIKNPFDVPVDFQLNILSDSQQSVIPASLSQLKPLETCQIEFALDAGNNNELPCPQITYKLECDGKSKTASGKVIPVNFIEVPLGAKIVIDGNEHEWSDIVGIETSLSDKIIDGGKSWDGKDDLSFSSKFSSDGEYLFGLVHVIDDKVSKDYSQNNPKDAVEFYWDARDDACRDGRQGKGTGVVRIEVPERDGDGKPRWFTATKANDARFMFTLKPDGYICEFAIKLSEFGLTEIPKQGDNFYFAIEIDDRDKVDQEITKTQVSSNGYSENFSDTNAYFKAVFTAP